MLRKVPDIVPQFVPFRILGAVLRARPAPGMLKHWFGNGGTIDGHRRGHRKSVGVAKNRSDVDGVAQECSGSLTNVAPKYGFRIHASQEVATTAYDVFA